VLVLLGRMPDDWISDGDSLDAIPAVGGASLHHVSI
jgi:hypothetical protein